MLEFVSVHSSGRKGDFSTRAGLNLDLFLLPAISLCSWTEHFLVYVVNNFTIMMVSYWSEI